MFQYVISKKLTYVYCKIYTRVGYYSKIFHLLYNEILIA
jgi:hypothetical protein